MEARPFRGAERAPPRDPRVVRPAARDARTEAGTAAYRVFWEPHTFTHPSIGPLWETLRANGIRIGVLSNTIWDQDYRRGIFERDGVLHLLDASTRARCRG